MAERRHGVCSRCRSPSPRRPLPRSRDINPSRHCKYSPYRGRKVEYSREAERSRRIEKRDHFDRDLNCRAPRFSEYDNRAREKDLVDGRQSRSPRRVEERDNSDRDMNMQPVRLSDYEDVVKGEVSVARSQRSYGEERDHFDRNLNFHAPRFSEYDNRAREKYLVGGRLSRSPRRVEKKNNDMDMSTQPARLSDYEDVGKGEVSVVHSRRSYGEDLYCDDLMKYRGDHLLDRSRTSDHLNVKDYRRTGDYNGSGYTNVSISGGEKDYYPYKHYADSNGAGLLSVPEYMDGTKPFPNHERGGRMHSHSYTLAHGARRDRPLSNLNGNNSSSHMPSAASRYLNTDTDRQAFVHFRDDLHLEKRDEDLHVHDDRFTDRINDSFHYQDGFLGMEKPVGGEIYKFKKEDDLLPSRGYLKGDSDYVLSSSQPKDYGSLSLDIFREGFPGYHASRDLPLSSHVVRPRSGLASEPISFDGYGEICTGPRGQLDDTRSRSRLYIELPEEKQGGQLYAEFDRSKTGGMRLNDVEEEYKDQHISRIDVLNPGLNESYHKRRTRDDGLWNQHPFSEVQLTQDKFDASGSRCVRKQDVEMFATGSSHLHYGTGGYYGYESIKREEHHAEVDGSQWAHVERSDILQSREYGPSFGGLYDSPRKRLTLADLSFSEPADSRLSHKHVRDEILYEHDSGVRISTEGNGAHDIYTKLDAGDEINLVRRSKERNVSNSKYEKTWRASRGMASDQPSSSKFDSRRVELRVSDSRDVKKRLGPVYRKLHVSQRLAKKYKSSVKKRLALAPSKKHANLPWLKNRSSKQTEVVQDDLGGSPHDHDGHHLGDHLSLAKPEPPENSEDFKQLVQSAFLKFLKQINETPTKRKKYTEQGKAGSLMCIVCSSNSDEFVETESLAMHAFTSKKVGFRSQHLGLHKALCVLMGWKITEDPSSEWHCEVMSNAEASPLKEDLIIWPPVVIVHNSTIDNKNPDERVIISTEKLDVKLRDMGFRNILKVCYGKPANQSVMLVKFNGTLSGLREAERYHSGYVESKHGRATVNQIKSGGTEVISAEREESLLYGYLGLAEDLGKLDFDTKKRCVLRSKKAILSIVEAP